MLLARSYSCCMNFFFNWIIWLPCYFLQLQSKVASSYPPNYGIGSCTASISYKKYKKEGSQDILDNLLSCHEGKQPPRHPQQLDHNKPVLSGENVAHKHPSILHYMAISS